MATSMSMSGINYQQLLNDTSDIDSNENYEDIIVNQDKYKKVGWKECNICSFKSDIYGNIYHYISCKYSKSKLEKNNISNGCYSKLNISEFDVFKCETINQRECGFTNKDRKYPIIGTYGASTCYILVIRDKITTNTLLYHIDSLTDLSIKQDMFKYSILDPSNTDIYLIGGNSTSKNIGHNILTQLVNCGFSNSLKFINILNSNSNSLIIDSRTGHILLDKDCNITYFKTSINKEFRKFRFENCLSFKSTLHYIMF